VCNEPWNNYPPGDYSLNPEPGQMGPGGYVPECNSYECGPNGQYDY
jgi:hypothetical protein